MLASPNRIGVPRRQPWLADQPRYTGITVLDIPGPWAHRFEIPGDEIIITPINNLPQLCGSIGAGPVTIVAPGTLALDPAGGQLNPAGTDAVWPAGGVLTLTPGVITTPGTFLFSTTFAVTGNPSGNPSLCTIVLGGAWPGGGPGAVVVPLPAAITGVVNPALAGDNLLIWVDPVAIAAASITYVPSGDTQVIDPCFNYKGLYGFIYFDEAMRQPLSTWDITPGVSGGFTHRGVVPISTFHPVRARQSFNSFTLTRATAQGWGQELIIQVRQAQDSQALDNNPTG